MHLRPPCGQKSNLKICQKIFSSIIPDEDDQHQSLAPITLTRQHKGAIRAIRKVRFLLIMQKNFFWSLFEFSLKVRWLLAAVVLILLNELTDCLGEIWGFGKGSCINYI